MECFDITKELALTLMRQTILKYKINCILSPFEADAQLAYLSRNNIVDFVISEDSDLIVFGCSDVVFKLDYNGDAKLINIY